MPDFSAEHDAAADSRTQRDHCHVWHAARCAQPLLAQRGNVGVIFKHDMGGETALDFGAHRIFFEAGKIGGFAQHSGVQIDDAGNADASAQEFSFLLIFSGELPDGVAHFRDDVVGAESGFSGEGDFLEKLPVGGDGGDAQVGAAEIDSDGEIGHGWRKISRFAASGNHC